MKRLRSSWPTVAVLSIVAWFWTSPVPAAKQAEKVRAADKIVVETLQHEAEKGLADRAAALHPAIELVPTHRQARWHSGFVYDTLTNQWLRFDELPQYCGKDSRLKAYRKVRDDAPQTPAGELELARWCKKHKLHSQARAHLNQILQQNPDHTEAHSELGERLIKGTWVSAADFAEAPARANQAADDLRLWKPRLERIRDDLSCTRRPKSDRAQAVLAEIRDPRAVAAIEAVLCMASEDLALYGVGQLANIPCKEAAAALAWHAVFSPWETVREAAGRALQSQAKHDYVPLLLGAMQAPIQSQVQIDGSAPLGLLLYRHMFYREGLDQRNLLVLDESYRHLFSAPSNGPSPATPGVVIGPRIVNPIDPTRLNADDLLARVDAWKAARYNAAMEAAKREKAVEQYNLVAEEMNSRISSALSQATGQTAPSTPAEWQSWWYYDNEVTPVDETPLRTHYHHRGHASVTYSTTAATLTSCLAPGTPVWTETGPVAVERVRVGDRVVACDPNTGALELKPVVRTTFNPNPPTLKLHVGGEIIETTEGHVFWVSGKGWGKARDLRDGMQLHTLQGTVEVRQVEPGKDQSMFNLVVADFHTYFAGKNRVLTHDVTIRKPTNCLVPGFNAVARDTAATSITAP